MTDWDADSERLRSNLGQVMEGTRQHALARRPPSLELPRNWHRDMMSGLTPEPPAEPSWFGCFRGEEGQEDIGVRVGSHEGTHPTLVSRDLEQFEVRLDELVTFLDEQLPAGKELDSATVEMMLQLMSWTHNEWVRIHPFANGNGRIFRIWANWVAMRYGLPPFVRLSPRPAGDAYANAATAAMTGDQASMVTVFRQMLLEFVV